MNRQSNQQPEEDQQLPDLDEIMAAVAAIVETTLGQRYMILPMNRLSRWKRAHPRQGDPHFALSKLI